MSSRKKVRRKKKGRRNSAGPTGGTKKEKPKSVENRGWKKSSTRKEEKGGSIALVAEKGRAALGKGYARRILVDPEENILAGGKMTRRLNHQKGK